MIAKTRIFLLILMVLSASLSAQILTSDEKAVFDEVVFKRKKVGEYELIAKWATPIRYRIYGDTSTYFVKEIDAFFNQLKTLTSLDIKKATNAEEENFVIVLGEEPTDFQAYTPTKTPLTSAIAYRFRTTNNNEINWAQCLVNTKKFSSRTNVKNALKYGIVKSLGFLKTSQLAPNSIFSIKNLNNNKVDEFDLHVISALYLPTLKAGMTRDEVEAILK